jgi:coenzyme F420-reducing hydrogenase alpha subunit
VQIQQTAILAGVRERLESIHQQMQKLIEDAEFERAYHSEHRKLQQSAAEYNKLKLENDSLEKTNTYYRRELIPNYDSVLQLQKQTLEETEAENLELKAKNRALEEDHARLLELLKTQDRRVDGLRAEIQVQSETIRSHDSQSPPAIRKRLRSSKPAEAAPAKRAMKSRLERPTEIEVGAGEV